MDAAVYTALAERLIVVAEQPDGTGVVTVAGSGVGGGVLSRAEADAAVGTIRPMVARAVADLYACPQDDDTSREIALRTGERVAEDLVFSWEQGGLYRVSVGALSFLGSQPIDVARRWAAKGRAELAAAIRLELEGADAILAAEHGPPDAPAQIQASHEAQVAALRDDNDALRRENEELRCQVAELRAQVELPPTVRIGSAEAPAQSGERALVEA